MEISIRDRITEMIEFNYKQPSGFNHDERIKWEATTDTLLDEHVKNTNKELIKEIERLKEFEWKYNDLCK